MRSRCGAPPSWRVTSTRSDATRRILRDGWLRTGDLGSIDDDGYLHFHRLKKPILNIHGNKIDPVEVCRVLCSLPAVSWAEVSATSGDSPDTKLRARICKVPGATLAPRDIRAHCRCRLAPYKVPARSSLLHGLKAWIKLCDRFTVRMISDKA